MAEAAQEEGVWELLGLDNSVIDEKGRIGVREAKRAMIGENFVVALEPTSCLAIYPNSVWKRRVSQIFAHDVNSSGTNYYSHLVLGDAERIARFDGQGRFVVPQRLREAAKLRDKIVIVGCGNRLEVWDAGERADFLAQPKSYGQERRALLDEAYRLMKGV